MSSAKKEVKQLLKSAKECVEQKRYEDAMTLCKRIVKADSRNFHGYFLAGFASRQLTQWTQAEKLYAKAIELQEDNVQGWLGRCELIEAQMNANGDGVDDMRRKQLIPIYKKLMHLFQVSSDEKKWREYAKKLAGVMEAQSQERLVLLKELESTAESNVEKVGYMAEIAIFVHNEESQEIEGMIHNRAQAHLDNLRKQAEQKLTKRRKLSARELQSMVPTDLELFPEKEREKMRGQWEEECTNRYLLQNEHGKFDRYIEQMLSMSRETTPMHLEQNLIERNFKRLALSGEHKYRQVIIDQCKRQLEFHKSAFYPMELLLLLDEEDEVQLDATFVASVEKRLMHTQPFEGVSLIRIAMRLLATVDLHTVQASAGATLEHNILDDIELLLNKGLVLSPAYINGWLVLGRVNFMRAKFLKVLDCVNHAQVNLNRREEGFRSSLTKLAIDINLLQADAYRMMPRQHKHASEIYKQVIEKDRSNTIALKGLARLASQDNNIAAAERIWRKVIEIDANDHDAYSELSWLLCQRGDYQDALEFAQRADKLTELSPHYLYRHRLARIYWELDDEYRMDKQYSHALLLQSAKLKPDFAPNFTYLGHYYAQIENDQDRSVKCYMKAISLDPMEEEAGNALGDLYERNKLYTMAVSLYRDTCSRSTRAKWSWKRLGFYEQSNRRLDEALIAFQHTLRVDPEDAMCWLGYAETMSRQGKFLAAVKAYAKTYELDNTLTYALCQMAYIKSLLGDLSEARSLFERTILSDETLLTAYTGLADVLRFTAGLNFDEGLFVDAAFNLMKAQLLLWAKENELSQFKAPWKLLGDIQSFFYFLPDGAIRTAYQRIQQEALSSVYGSDEGKLKSKLPTRRLQFVQMAKHSFRKALDSNTDIPESDALAFAHFDIGLACCFCKELTENDEEAQLAEREALHALRQAITTDPKNSLFWNAMGCAYSDLQRKQHCFIKAIQYNIKFHIAWNNLGVLYLQQSKFNLAQAAFINAQNLMPTDCVPFIGLAMLNEKIGVKKALEKAQDGFAHAASLENTALTNIGLGYTAFINSDFQISSNAMFKYLQFFDSDPNAYNVLGIALEAQGKFTEAENAMRTCCALLEARKRDANEQDGGITKWDAPESQSMNTEKSIVFKGYKSLTTDTELILARVNHGRLLMRLGHHSEAYDLLKNHILSRVPYLVKDTAVKIDMALCCFYMGRLDESFSLLKEAIQSSSAESDTIRQEQSMLLEAKLQYHAGDTAASNRLMIDCMRQFSQSLPVHLAYASFSALTNSDLTVALKVLHRINDKITFGTDRETLLLKSNIHLMHGDIKRARHSMEKLIHLFPERHDLWDKLAALVTGSDHQQHAHAQKDFMSVHISQLCAQLLGPSISHFVMSYFDNDVVKLSNRLYNIASLYNAMGIAPNYHGAEYALRYALRMAQKALRFNPTHKDAHRLIASSLHSLAAFKKQHEQFISSINVIRHYMLVATPSNDDNSSVKLDNLPLTIALAEDYISAGRIDNSIELIRDAMKLTNGTNSAEVSMLFAVLGRCLRARGEADDKVLKSFKSALKKCPLNLNVWFNLVDMLIHDGRFAAAESCLLAFERVINAAAESDSATSVPTKAWFNTYTYLAYVRYHLGNIKGGVIYARAAVKGNAASPVATLLLGMLQLKNGDMVKAEINLRKAANLDPGLPLAHLTLYKIHYKREEWEEAEQCLWREKALQPQESFILYSLGLFAFESGVPETALTLVQKAYHQQPKPLYWEKLQEIRKSLKSSKE